ncbi:MAG: hypothetical protein GY798_08160 [Hyphomicrobiales bacterium]|nr:hypothetical protein [Hyphomicrobiales bacterium]
MNEFKGKRIGRAATDASDRDELSIFKPRVRDLRINHSIGERSLDIITRYRIITIILLTWIPIFLMSLFEGTAWSPDLDLSFLGDWVVHTRFLVVIPLFLLADRLTDPLLRSTAAQLTEASFVPDESLADYRALARRHTRLAQSHWIDVAIVLLVMAALLYGIRRESVLPAASWQGVPQNNGLEYSLSGWWLYNVGIPIYQFILLKWFWRYFVWCKFLWSVSRMHLNLIAIHPDRTGGLGFIGIAQASFAPFVLGVATLYFAIVGRQIYFENYDLTAFIPEIVALVVLNLGIFLLPLMFFAPQLTRLRVTEIRRYSAFSGEAIRSFDKRWLVDGAKTNSPRLLDSGNVDAVANLGFLFGTVERLKPFPINLATALTITGAALLPILIPIMVIYSPSEIFEVVMAVFV